MIDLVLENYMNNSLMTKDDAGPVPKMDKTFKTSDDDCVANPRLHSRRPQLDQ